MKETHHHNSIDLELLNAYLDGELGESSRSSVRKQLQDDPEARSLLEQYRWQDNALRKAFDESLNEPVPEEFDHIIGSAREKPEENNAYRGRLPRMHLAAAAGIAVLTLAIGLTAGWSLRSGLHQMTIQQAATEIFLDHATTSYALLASGEGWRTSEQFLRDREELAMWFRQTLERNVPIPRLDEAGYDFVGGQLLSKSPRGAGQMFYRDRQGRMVAVYVQANQPCADHGRTVTDYVRSGCGNGFEGMLVERNNLPVYYWKSKSGRISYALLGAIESDAFSMLVNTVLEQLNVQPEEGSGVVPLLDQSSTG